MSAIKGEVKTSEEAKCKDDQAHMDQMLWERHLATTEAAQAKARCLDPQAAAALLASYERQAELWANQGALWCDLATSWRELAMTLMAQSVDKMTQDVDKLGIG